jgi:hypothetical protein
VGLDLRETRIRMPSKEQSVMKWWWKCAPKPAATVLALVLTSGLATAAGAADPFEIAQTDTIPATPPAPAAPVDPKEAEERAEAERKAAEEKAEAEKKARELAEAEEARKSGIPWRRDANWMTFRFGTSGSKVENSPDAGIALGIGGMHFRSPRWAYGLNLDVDVLGKFNGATQMEIPITVELSRHMRWGSDTFRPFLGTGLGAYYYRTYRTGADATDVRPGFHLSGGFNSPISGSALLGVVARGAVQWGAELDDPYFPNESNTAVHWSVKLSYIRVN